MDDEVTGGTLSAAAGMLREAERLAGLGSWMYDVERDRSTWSEGLREIGGLSSDGPGPLEKFLTLIHEEDRQAASDVIRRAMAGGPPLDMTFRIRHGVSGETRWIRARGISVRGDDGRVVRMYGAAQDVTDRERAERELAQSKHDLTEFVDALTTFIAKLTPEGRIWEVGAGVARKFGTEKEYFLGKIWQDGPWWTYDPEVHETVRQHFARAAAGGSVRFTAPLMVGDSSRMIDVGLTPLLDASGKTRYIVAEGSDVDDQHRLQNVLAAERARLARANADLEAFTYTVSHDLRAPLRGVTMYAELLEEEHATELSSGARAILGRLRSESDRMGVIISDLLALALGDHGELRRTVVDLSAIARSVAGVLATREPTRAVTVSIAPGMVAECDGGLVRIALENLISNAWKFTEHQAEARIEVGVEDTPEGPCYFVRDNGVGFEQEKADDLFAPFKRLHVRAGFRGTGVGLTTARRVVEAHGGRIWAEGSPGKGATFRFTLAGPAST